MPGLPGVPGFKGELGMPGFPGAKVGSMNINILICNMEKKIFKILKNFLNFF
jgi:hypothetical protein